MIDGKRVLALVPARGGSKGLPGKNVRPLLGKPLVAWPIAAARESCCVDRVIVSTDYPEIAAVAREWGAETPFLRPEELAADTSPSADMICHALNELLKDDAFEYFILLEPTSPCTEGKDVDAAIERLHESRSHADAIVGVSAYGAHHPAFAVRVEEGGFLAPFALQAGQRDFSVIRRQDAGPLFFMDGSLYASKCGVFLQRKTFYHDRTLGYETPKWKSFEIDDLIDFFIIESILRNKESF